MEGEFLCHTHSTPGARAVGLGEGRTRQCIQGWQIGASSWGKLGGDVGQAN